MNAQPVHIYARDMCGQIAARLKATNEWYGDVKTAAGATLLARYQWWAAKDSANPGERLRSAKDLYAMARDMELRPGQYRFPNRDINQSCWQRFLELQSVSGRPRTRYSASARRPWWAPNNQEKAA